MLVKSFPIRVRSAVGRTVFLIFLAVCSVVSGPGFSQSQPAAYKTIHVKFKEEFIPSQTGRSTRSGMQAMDLVSEKYDAVSMQRLFPDGGKFEKAHQAYGLHLWYEIKFPTGADTTRAIVEYKNLEYFQKVEACREYTAGWDRNAKELLETVVLTGGANDPLYKNQWHYKNTGQSGGTPNADINLEKAWRIETGSSNVIVAVIDGGVDINHPDLKAALWKNSDEISANGIDDDHNGYIDDIHGYGFGDGSSSIPSDVHGTHVAGTIGAISNNGIGVAGIAGGSGTANGARIMSLATFGQFSNGGFESAMVYAADNGAVISQNSWGGGSTAIEAAIGYFIDRAGLDNTNANFDAKIQTGPMAGGIVIFAAGNDNTFDAFFGYPGSHPRVMAVASLNHNDVKAGTSNYGGWVDISAPGDQVLSTKPGSQYGLLSGTSMACPHVSGVAALLVSHLQQPGLKPSEIRNRLLQSAKSVDDKNPDYIGMLGSGKLNAFSVFGKRDLIPPGAITDLHASIIRSNSITLQWTAPAESGDQGGATEKYEIRMSATPINESNFSDATRLSAPVPAIPGQQQTLTVNLLNPQQVYYFAIKSTDVFYTTSALSNIAMISTLSIGILEASPDEVSVTLLKGETSTHEIELTNNGVDSEALDLTLEFPDGPLDWVTFSNENIHLASGETKHASITFHTDNLVPGEYTGRVWMLHNNSSVYHIVNLTLIVTIPAGLDVQNDIDFGNVLLNGVNDSTITLHNLNATELIISNIESSDSRVTVSASTLTLAPGEEAPLTIHVVSSVPGSVNATLTFTTNIEPVIVSVRAGIIAKPILVTPTTLSTTLSLSEIKTFNVSVTNTSAAPFHWNTNHPAATASVNLEQFVTKASSPVALTALSYDPDGGFMYGKAIAAAAFYRYDFTANAWSAVAAGPTTILGQAVYLNGKIYHSGQQLEIYTVQSNSWISVAYPVAGTSQTVTTDGEYVYMAFGKVLYRYDPDANTWLQLVTFTGGYSNSVGALDYWNGIIYAAEDASTGIEGDSNTPFYKYYIQTNTWLRTNSLNGKVSWGSAIDRVSGKHYTHQSTRNGPGTQQNIYDLRLGTEVQATKPFDTGAIGSMVYVGKPGFVGIYSVHGNVSFFRYETSPPAASWISVTPAQGEIPAGATQNLIVSIGSPDLAAGIYTGELKILTETFNAEMEHISITATVSNSPDILLDKVQEDVEEVGIGNSRASSVRIRNTGTAPLVISNVTSDNPRFMITPTSFTIPAGEVSVVFPYFQPIISGPATGTFTFHSNDPDEPAIQFIQKGTGVTSSIPEITPASLSVNLLSGDKLVREILIKNVGESTIFGNLLFEDNWLTSDDVSGSISPGQTRTVHVTIDASGKAAGAYEGKAVFYYLDIATGTQPEIEIPISITVTGAPGIQLNKQSLSFGSQYIGNLYDLTLQISNKGVLPLSITAITSDNVAFSISAAAPLNLAPGESVEASITFNPASGAQSGNIAFISNDPNDGIYTLAVTGTGVTVPNLTATVTEVQQAAFTDEQKSQTFNLTNTGGSDLSWQIVYVTDGSESVTAPDWLTASPLSSVIESSSSQEIELNFSAHDLNTATYETVLKITSNDPDEPLREIPVTFEVTNPGAVIKVPELLTGSLARSAFYTTTLKIENTGAASLEWNLVANLLPVGLTVSKSSGTIVAGGFENVTVTYVPGFFSPRIFDYALEINSNDRFAPVVSTQLTFVVTTVLNMAPVVEQLYEDRSAVIGTPPLEVLIDGTFSDPEGDAIRYTVKSSNDQVASLNLVDNKLKIFIFNTGSSKITITGTDTFDSFTSTDFDVTISEIVTAVEPGIEKTLSAYPNPFTHQVSIKYTAEKPTHAAIMLFDISGKMVWQSNDYSETQGVNELLINGNQLPSGIYHARLLRKNNPIVTVRLLKH